VRDEYFASIIIGIMLVILLVQYGSLYGWFFHGAKNEPKRIYCYYLDNSLTDVNQRQVRDAFTPSRFSMFVWIRASELTNMH